MILPGVRIVESTITIDYTYDLLYRLMATDYSDGKYFHYTYDSFGNRLTQASSQQTAVRYQYASANRLTSAGGALYLGQQRQPAQ